MITRRLSLYSLLVQSRKELIEQLNAYLREAALYIIGSFSIASHYIIRLKNNFLIGFSKLSQFLLYMVDLKRFHIYVCACVWPCVVFLYILGILRAATCACMCAYILSFQIKAISLELNSWAAGLWLLYIYFTK